MEQHSPDPWQSDERYDSHDEGKTYLEVKDAEGRCLFGEHVRFEDKDIRRIVACVNFLRGVPTEELEFMVNAGATVRNTGRGSMVIEFPTPAIAGATTISFIGSDLNVSEDE